MAEHWDDHEYCETCRKHSIDCWCWWPGAADPLRDPSSADPELTCMVSEGEPPCLKGPPS